ncbi:hypothetical protein R5O20_06865 [Tenacibaculum maritimum]|uniref:hypothetical protein n=1 Tax=Tenacibaculum maritimum TaxID=107401 RepID=UPI003890649E
MLKQLQSSEDIINVIYNNVLEINTLFQESLNKIQLPETIWNPDAENYTNNDFHFEPLEAGLIDGAIEEIKSIPLLISLVVDYSTNPKTREKINKAFSDFDFINAMDKWYESRKDLYTSGTIHKIEHRTGKDVVEVGTLIGTGGLATLGKIKKGADLVEGVTSAIKKVAKAGGDLIKRLDELNLSVLTKKLDDLEDAVKTKFFDDFADISDDGLKILDKKINLIDHWKNYKQYFLDKKYRAPDDIDQVYNSLSEGGMKEMVKKVNEILPPFKNGSYVISGGYHSKLDDIVIKNNIPKVDGVKNERKFNKLVEGLEPELREHVEYLDFIREDFKAHKALDQESKKGVHNKLLNIAKGKENKLIQAGKPGSHAEVQVVNEIIKKLRQKGENINLEEIFLYVKNKNNRNMCRCPNCFYILKNKVKMIGNE